MPLPQLKAAVRKKFNEHVAEIQGLINNNLDQGDALIIEEFGKCSNKEQMSPTKKQLSVDLISMKNKYPNN